MLENTINYFYQSLANSINDRKNLLKLNRDEILENPTRISHIINAKRNRNHPYMLGQLKEYNYLYDLYQYDDRDTFLTYSLLAHGTDSEKRQRRLYDKMLWGHIDWNELFNHMITELSELDETTDFRQFFERALIDNVHYIVVKHNQNSSEPELNVARRIAIKTVFSQYDIVAFKDIFMNKFKWSTLSKFDDVFETVVYTYLSEKEPAKESLGLLAMRVQENSDCYRTALQSAILVDSFEDYIKETNAFLAVLANLQNNINYAQYHTQDKWEADKCEVA